MKITDLLKREVIEINQCTLSKQTAIDRLTDLMCKADIISDKQEFIKYILERETEKSTGFGGGIAIPHAKSSAVNRVGIAAMTIKCGVDFNSLDGESTKLIFMIAVPDMTNATDNAVDLHLEVLSMLSTILADKVLRRKLMDSQSDFEFLYYINEAEKSRGKKTLLGQTNDEVYDIIAVTACPSGIAHTYMAAEALENAGKELGISIKVETDGSAGVKNKLTENDIQKSKCVIVAADTTVEMSRFNGKKLINISTGDAIYRAKDILEDAVKYEAPTYYNNKTNGRNKANTFRQIYVHLMSGISNMLPFVIGGGILIALAFLFDDYSINPQNFGSNLPLPAFLKFVGDTSFGFMLPVLAGFIAMSIGDRPALSVGFVGGYLAKEGGSGFLGAIAAGFIAGYIMVLLRNCLRKIPESLEGIKPVLLYPVIGILMIGIIVKFGVNPPVGALNSMIFDGLNSMGSTSRVFLGIILGGMMAVDMGGPVNKAAYVFGTASLENGQFEIMAAVMAGGMIPSLATALCTTFFGNRFTSKEKQSGLVNYILGMSFISEGAIPFAAVDPFRVIPSCVIGSATAGGLSMFFNCTLRAPAGGIFVIPLAGNPLGFIIAIITGSVVGMICLAVLKKPLRK